VTGLTDAALEAAAAAAAAAVTAAIGSSAAAAVLGSWGEAASEEAPEGAAVPVLAASGELGWGGCKWFVGHSVPCGSEAAARQLQQLLQRACQRLDIMIASHSWQRGPLF
jgi:hypothetical protein